MSKQGQGLKERNYATAPGAQVSGTELVVKTALIHPNDYNYNKMTPAAFNKLVEIIREFGFTAPIIVRNGDVVKKGKKDTVQHYRVIDGEHRWRAAIELHMPEVRVINLGDVSDERAKQLTIILNEMGGSPDQVRLAELMREINETVDFNALAKVMPYSQKELSALIDTIDFSFASLSDRDSRPQEEQTPEGDIDAAIEQANIPPEELGPDADEAAARAGMATPPPRMARLTLHVEAASVKELEIKLAKIADDPTMAVETAVDFYLANYKPPARKKKEQ